MLGPRHAGGMSNINGIRRRACSRKERDLLMCSASRAALPSASVLPRRSLPARSTRFSFERSTRPSVMHVAP